MDTFLQSMNNIMDQHKLCTEAKENPQEAFRFAVAYEEGVIDHKISSSETYQQI